MTLQATFEQGIALHRQGKLAEAERIYGAILQQEPNHFDALHLMGVIAYQTRRMERAVELFARAIGSNATVAAAHGNLANALMELKRRDEALVSFDRAIALKPDYAEAYFFRGNVLLDLRRPADALASFDAAIALKPDYAEAFSNRGNALLELQHLEEALASYDRAIALRPEMVAAHNNRGNVLQDLKRPAEALASYDRVIALQPGIAQAHNNRGNALRNLKRPEQALASYDRAIALKPDYAEAYGNRGNVLHDLKRAADALASFDRAIELEPRHAEAYCGRGNVLNDLKRPAEALASFDKAIALRPDYAEAYSNRGTVLMILRRASEALGNYERAIALKPGYAEAYSNRGNALRDLKRLEEALASCEKAIALKPDCVEAHSTRGDILMELKRPDEALASLARAIALNPGYAEAYSNRAAILYNVGRYEEAVAEYERASGLESGLVGVEGGRLYSKMHICDWSNFDAERARLIASVRNGDVSTTPFSFLAMSSSSADQLQCARSLIAYKFPAFEKPVWQGERYVHDRIRIAYVSADFRAHAVSFLIAGMLECHDRSRFEVTAISIGPDDGSEVRRRLQASVEHFIDARTFSDEQIADLVRSLEVDILVDLMGFTMNSRTGIFARRPPPIQVSYLGFAGTMGAPYIDYILADRSVIPEEKRAFFSEKVVYLPDSFMPNDSKRKSSERLPRRSDCNLPETGFVFCSFNNSYKIIPPVFDIWMRLLRQLDDSVLWLTSTNEAAMRNLRREAHNRGVDPDRLVFAPRLPLNEDHLARHRLADLFLDTLPYNAHTTASDALWAGLPVLTCLGETFAGRVAASLLNSIRLPELITTTPDAYEQMAFDLATHPEKLANIRDRLAVNRLTTPLFDTGLFTSQVEAAYAAMQQRHRAGLAPDHIVVPN